MIFSLGLSRLDFLLLLFPTRHFAPKHFFFAWGGEGKRERDGGTGIPDPARETGPVAFYSFLGDREESYGFAFPKKGAKNKFLTKSRKKKGHYVRKVIALRVKKKVGDITRKHSTKGRAEETDRSLFCSAQKGGPNEAPSGKLCWVES